MTVKEEIEKPTKKAATSLSRDKSLGFEISEFGKSPAMNSLRCPAQLLDFVGCPVLSW